MIVPNFSLFLASIGIVLQDDFLVNTEEGYAFVFCMGMCFAILEKSGTFMSPIIREARGAVNGMRENIVPVENGVNRFFQFLAFLLVFMIFWVAKSCPEFGLVLDIGYDVGEVLCSRFWESSARVVRENEGLDNV